MRFFELPHTLTRKKAVFVEPFANSVNAWETASPDIDNSIAIVGGGLGLGIVACAVSENLANINLADWSASRCQAAKDLGATFTGSSLNGNFDIVFETVGSQKSRDTAISLTKKGGKYVFLGFETPTYNANFNELIRHQKQLLGSFIFTREQFSKAIQLAHRCNDEWVTEVGLHEVESHLGQFQKGNFDIVKLAANPDLSC